MDSIDTSGKALVAFWKNAGDKGEVNPNTAASYRGTCATVLSAVDDWETTDVRTLDIDATFRRFVNKNSSKFKQASLQSYGRRWPVAVRSFLEYAKDPAVWKAPASDKPSAGLKKGRPAQEESPGPRGPDPIPAANLNRVVGGGANFTPGTVLSGLVEYPFPLRQGRLAYLRLPVDLTGVEIKRLTAFLNTLAVDDIGQATAESKQG